MMLMNTWNSSLSLSLSAAGTTRFQERKGAKGFKPTTSWRQVTRTKSKSSVMVVHQRMVEVYTTTSNVRSP